jgi:hypothetical protein
LSAQLFRRVGDVPRLRALDSQFDLAKGAQLGRVLLGERPRWRARSSRNASTCAGDSRHLRLERDFGVVGVAEERGELAAQLDDARDERVLSQSGLPNSEARVALSR